MPLHSRICTVLLSEINFRKKRGSFWIRRLILLSSPHWVWEIAAVQSYTRFRPHRPWPGSVRTAFDLRCALWLKSAAGRENGIFTKCFTCTRHAYLHANLTYPGTIVEGLLGQWNSHVLLLGAHSHHQHSLHGEKSLEPCPTCREEARRAN